MFTGSLDYIICFSDPNYYNKIYCNLTAPITKYAKMIVTCLTANFNIVVLDENDYITITELDEKTTYKVGKKIRGDNIESFITFLKTEILAKIESISLDECNKLIIRHNHKFVIKNVFYNLKILTVWYNTTFPIESVYDPELNYYSVTAQSVGMDISTPLLCLTSNIGM